MNPTRAEPKGGNQNFKRVVFFFATSSHHGTRELWGETSKVVEESLRRKLPVLGVISLEEAAEQGGHCDIPILSL